MKSILTKPHTTLVSGIKDPRSGNSSSSYIVFFVVASGLNNKGEPFLQQASGVSAWNQARSSLVFEPQSKNPEYPVECRRKILSAL